MNIEEMNLGQIIERLAQLDIEVRDAKEVKDVETLTEEKKTLLTRKAELEDLEQRKADALKINNGQVQTKTIEERKETKNMNELYNVESKEYRSAFLNNLRSVDLNEVEQRAFSTVAGSAEAVIPTETQNKIVEVIKQQAPLLAEINLLEVPGGVRVPVEDVVNEAISHVENATITVSDDKLKYVDLFGYEITKLLQISKSVMQMSVDAFENWLATNLGKSIAAKITSLIINGTGEGEAKGINTITWDETNSVTVALAGSLSAKNVTDLIGLLPGGYDANGKFLMSKKTLFTDFMPLKDASKHDLVTREGNTYYIYGYEVMLDERIKLSEAILGDFKAGYYGNMPEEVNVDGGFERKTNSYEYLGAAMFDGEVALPNAFVKLIKAIA